MAQRSTARQYTSSQGVVARAGRAHEDPVAMNADARMVHLAEHVAAVLKKNPDLTALQAANAARLTIRAEMTKLGQKSAAARRARAEAARAEAADLDPVVTDALTA